MANQPPRGDNISTGTERQTASISSPHIVNVLCFYNNICYVQNIVRLRQTLFLIEICIKIKL